MGRKETEEAIEESRKGGLKQFTTVAELMADLNADDENDRQANIAQAIELARRVDAGLEPLMPFDPAQHLTTAEAVAALLANAEATGDVTYIEHAHQIAARARAMHGIAS